MAGVLSVGGEVRCGQYSVGGFVVYISLSFSSLFFPFPTLPFGYVRCEGELREEDTNGGV